MKANTRRSKRILPRQATPRLLFMTALTVALAAVLVLVATQRATVTRATTTTLTPLTVTQDTAEKPQSKVWQYNNTWWAVLPNSSGTWVWRLQPDNSWTNVLKVSDSTNARADVKAVGGVTHILLHDSTPELVSVEHVSADNTYQLWSTRQTSTAISLPNSEIATIDIDSTGRMWLATENGSDVNVYYSDSPYSSFSGPITLANNITEDDISDVIAMPGNKVGILWSNMNTQRFGFKTHTDGADPSTWSADEVPASQSALPVGAGMADDHLNMKVGSDGTLYAAVKTSYDWTGYPKIALLVRRPGGTWDNLYGVDEDGTRGIVTLNEAEGTLRVIYTTAEGGGDIVYKESLISSISFGSRQTLMTSGLNNPTSTKQNWTSSLVVLASIPSYPSSAYGALITSEGTPTPVPPTATATPTPTATPDPCGAGGLVGYWAMEEGSGTTLIDSSSPANNATTVGNPPWVAGKVGSYALSLNGTSQYATVPNDTCLQITGSITMAAWIAPNEKDTARIMAKAVMSSIGGYELSLASTGTVFFRLNQTASSGGYRIDSATQYPIIGTTWIHVAATYDGTTKQMKLYINGVADGTQGTGPTSIMSNTEALQIGRQNSAGSPYYYYGKMDEARIYNRALDACEIRVLAGLAPCTPTPTPTETPVPVGTPTNTPIPTATPTPTATLTPTITPTPLFCGTDGLVARYRMDENGGTTLADSSPPANDGTIYGSPTWVTGQDGLALNLNGTTQYGLVPNDPCLNITGPITLAGWVRPGQLATQDLVKKAVNGGTNGYELSLSSSSSTWPDKVFFRLNQLTSADTYRVNSTTLYLYDGSTWIHVAGTYDGTNMRIYVNGVMEGTPVAGPPGGIVSNTNNLGIGAQSDGTRWFKGAMDEVRVYNRALSAAEIEALAATAPTPTPTPTNTATATPTETYTPTPTDTPVPTPTETFTPTPTNTYTPTPTPTNTFTPTPTNTYTPTPTPVPPSPTPTPTNTFTPTPTNTYTPTPTPVPPSPTPTPTNTFTPTPTNTYTPTPTPTFTSVPPTPTLTPTPTKTYTPTPTLTPTPTKTFTPTPTITSTPAVTPTISPTPTATPFCGENGLIVRYEMEENGGTTLVDSTTPANNGTIFGAPSWVPGVHNLALNFHGASDYARTPDDYCLDIQNALTITLWVRPEQLATQDMVKKAVKDSVDGYEITLATGSGSPSPYKVFFRLNDKTSGDTYRIASTTNYPTDGNTWIHVAGTYDGTTMRIYYNGVLEGSIAGPPAILTNDEPLRVGQNDSARFFKGTMDDVRVYNRALSGEEIAELAVAPPTPTPTPTETYTPTPTETYTPTPTETYTPTPTETYTPTPTETYTPTPTNTYTPTPTETYTPTPTETYTPTPTETFTPTPTETFTPTPTQTYTPTPTQTFTPTPTETPAPTPTPTATACPGDADCDGVLDAVDNCPSVYNPDQKNSDGGRRPAGSQIPGGWASNPAQDRLGDACDPDNDNDALPDSDENESMCPFRLTGDSDGDRSLDGYEVSQGKNACSVASKPACSGIPDSDGDGFSDCVEHSGYNTCASTGDTTPGYTICENPTDSDGDVCPDWVEIADVNGDRAANILDVQLAAKRVFNVIPASDSDVVLDINKDGSLNILDVQMEAKNSSLVKPQTPNPCPPEG